MAFLLRKEPKERKKDSNNIYAFSNETVLLMTEKLKKPVALIDNLDKIEEDSTVIFDASSMTYREIISNMINLNKKKNISFRICVDKSNFIIGSDSSNMRGEVITF